MKRITSKTNKYFENNNSLTINEKKKKKSWNRDFCFCDLISCLKSSQCLLLEPFSLLWMSNQKKKRRKMKKCKSLTLKTKIIPEVQHRIKRRWRIHLNSLYFVIKKRRTKLENCSSWKAIATRRQKSRRLK